MPIQLITPDGYGELLSEVSLLLEAGRTGAGRAVNSIITATYWQVGRRIVEREQGGSERAGYGEALIGNLAQDLTARFGRGFSRSNLSLMRLFFLMYPPIIQTPSGLLGKAKKKIPTPSGLLDAPAFLLSWSHYARLLTVDEEAARNYYETEGIRGGWSVRELDRQIATQAYARLRRKKRKTASKEPAHPADSAIRDPFVLEFLNLKDEYSESDLEEALVLALEQFLLELGNEFAFVARQRKLRVGTEWYRIDLLLFHRALRCLVVIELKVGKFTHADAGQMNLYLNYAKEHWTMPGENPPVGLILCSEQDAAVAHYSLDGLKNKMMARKYQLALPDASQLIDKIRSSRRRLLDTR